MSRARVKICGVTRVEDARTAVDLGAEFVGLNFYPGSPRCVDLGTARRVRQAVGDEARVVGVFVDWPPERVAQIEGAVGLDLIQFHGHEGPEQMAPFRERAIKVFRVGSRLEPSLLDEYSGVWGFLFDRGGGGELGGSGRAWRWERVADIAPHRPFFVAGGIRPGNVSTLLERFSPWGLDVCSGVELSPGIKDRSLLQNLFQEITHAESQTTS